MKSSHKLSRRRFLKLGCAGVGSTALFSSLTHLGAFSAAAAQTLTPVSDYRALVCVLLAGGNDSFNMLTPIEQSAYHEYQAVRSDLALAQNALLPLSSSDTNSQGFGLHPGMPELQQLFNSGKAAFLANVGTLVEPTSLTTLESGAVQAPLGLYSHADQIDQWQTALPDKRALTGWGGRLGDVLSSLNQSSQVSMNISLSGTNIFQTGNIVVADNVTSSGVETIFDYGDTSNDFGRLQTDAIDGMMNQTYKNLFEQAYANRFKRALTVNQLLKDALSTANVSTAFSANEFSASLRTIAQLIASRDQLGMKRQVFFVLFGGWDHHDNTLQNQQIMLPILSRGLGEFQQAMTTLGVEQQVTTFTTSDFGRTLTSNGRGSDHGWGGNHIITGGAVNGGKVYGEYPRLFAGNPLDTGRGRLIPTTSVDEYFAELALWLGVDNSALTDVLPNLDRFYTPTVGTSPLGFMQSV